MIKFYSSVIMFALLFVTSGNLTAQQSIYPKNSPGWLVDMFFKQSSFPGKQNYLADEMLRDLEYPTIGEELHGGAVVSFRAIEMKSNSAVYAVEISGNNRKALFYSFLKKDAGTWKIHAIRKFQMPKFIYTVIDSLSGITNPSNENIALLNSLVLITGSDDKLKSFLSENITDLYKAISAFEQKNSGTINSLMKKLGLDYIYKDELYPACIFIMIGGFERIEAGFIYTQSEASLPGLSPGRFILIEEVLPNWYIYRAM